MGGQRAASVPVAVVGIGVRLPGGVVDTASYWRLLCEGANAVGEIPQSRIDREYYFDPEPAQPGRIMTRWGGFLDGIEDFDASFFGISPREAERIDPQQRLICEAAWEALEDAGQDAERLRGSRTGVFVGQWLTDFEARMFADPAGVDFYMTLGSGRYATSGRLSYVLDLRGPSVTLDTACSSSLAAVHWAVKSLQSGESDYAFAGGVNVILEPQITIAYSQSRMMAPDGRCKFGDASANGYVRSEGAGVVFLKRLEQALADGDRVYAVVRGSAVGNDGHSSGSMGTVSRPGQEELLRAAYRDAGVSAGRVGYVEAHGTGTQGGDPVELGALGSVLAEAREPGFRAYVGSVKTNVGHTEGAAGITGFIKAALALYRDRIPASLHFETPNPKVPWSELPFTIPRALSPWPIGKGPRLAGVSAFGIAGSNAHVVLEEAPPVEADVALAEPSAATDTPRLLPLSARSPEALTTLAMRYAAVLDGPGAPALADVCSTAATRRTPLEQRAVFVARDRASMSERLRSFAAGAPPAAAGVVPPGAAPRLVFVLPGQGGQWAGMGRELARTEPVFRATLEACDAAARPFADFSLLEQLALDPSAAGYRLRDIDVIQPALVALAIAYAALWRSRGVEPDAVVGHSMGEVAAAHVAGALELGAAMQIICRRSALMRRAAGNGAMALIDLSFEAARARIARFGKRLALAGDNSPTASVISGEPHAIQEVLAELEREAIFCRRVKVDVASHSPQMEPLAALLREELAALRPSPALIPIYSTVLARRVEGTELDAAYWAQNLRQPVLFGTTVQALLEADAGIFLELGPHPVLLPSIEQTARVAKRSVTVLACGRREEPELDLFLTALGGLWAAGRPLDWAKANPGVARPLDLPLYPWQRERHWVEAAELVRGAAGARVDRVRPSNDARDWVYRFAWEEAPFGNGNGSRPAGSWLIVSDDEEGPQSLARALAVLGAPAVTARLLGLDAALAEHAATLAGVVLLVPEREDAAYLPIRIVQALLAKGSAVRPKLWLATRGAQAILGETHVSIEQAAVWGAGRVLAEEQPDLWGGLVDLDPAASPSDEATALATQLLAPDAEEQVAFREKRRFALRLVKYAPTRAPAPFAWRGGAVLITGGLGEIGLKVARALVSQGVRRLILLGRTPLPPRGEWKGLPENTRLGGRVAAVRELEALGASILTAAVDVSREDQLRAFLERYEAEAWPAIRGVIHAAASVDDHLAADMTREQFDGVMQAKLRGARLLDRLLPDLELFVVFSSIVAYVGLVGAANYAAANAGVDALVRERRARGRHGLSLGWGVWQGVGLANANVMNEFARQGVQGFAAEDAIALFSWLLGTDEPALAVVRADWDAFRRARLGRGATLYRNLLSANAASAGGADLSARLAAVGHEERRRLVEELVKQSVAAVLKIAPARLDAHRTLGSFGLSSLMAMELRNRLELALARALPATLAWNYPTVEAMVDHLTGDAPAPAAPVAAPTPVTLGLQEIAELSDEEAALALRRARSEAGP
jgi:phthiocerol/phenolphthiocerol synthesis type-I polyketide synthase B